MSLLISELIWTVFPFGTDLNIVSKLYDDSTEFDVDEINYNIEKAPLFPSDLFAVTGYLIEQGGAYHWLIAARSPDTVPLDSLGITPDIRRHLNEVGLEWATGKAAVPDDVKKLWKRLLEFEDEPICNFTNGQMHNAKKPPEWLEIAYKLFAISDAAAVDVGYREPVGHNWNDKWFVQVVNQSLVDSYSDANKEHFRLSDQRASITSQAVDDDVVCVQPKAKTSQIGCSLRNLSHNLSLLPARGRINACWMPPPVPILKEEKADLKILLVPFPFSVNNSAFRVRLEEEETDSAWGWFELNQEWMNAGSEKIVKFIDSLIKESESSDRINGIVFPELSLNYNAYEKIIEHISENYQSIEFVVAGVSENCIGEKGNFVLSTHFFDKAGNRLMATTSRPKHHRWAIEGSQVKAYGLEDAFPKNLSENSIWWEKIRIPPRQIHFHPMRSGSVYSVMICEDLARTDPVHDPLKSVGPNLVFALLFDGPQLERRWSSRQAMSLSEDPGCSVLTLTSRALIERWNIDRDEGDPDAEHSWAVATWKDKKGRAKIIECPPGNHAVRISIRGHNCSEATMDGRICHDSFEWEILESATQMVSLDSDKYSDILREVN